MKYNLSRVNQFLNNNNNKSELESEIITSGPDCIKNIFISEAMKATKLEMVSDELIRYLTDSRAIKNLSYREKQSLLRDITAIKADSRDFMVRFTDLATKNELVKKVIEMVEGPNELVRSESGEVYNSGVDEHTRQELTEMLRNIVNDRIRNNY